MAAAEYRITSCPLLIAVPSAASLYSFDHLPCLLRILDTSGRLDSNALSDHPSHQCHIGGSGPTRAKTCGGLDKISAYFLADLACPNLLTVIEISILEDHLHDRALLVGSCDDRSDILSNSSRHARNIRRRWT